MQVEEDVISSFFLEDCKLKRRPELEATVGCGCIGPGSLTARLARLVLSAERAKLPKPMKVLDYPHS